MESPRWNIITPSQYEWEQRGLDFIRTGLPDHDPYRAWANFEVQTSDGATPSPAQGQLVSVRSRQWIVTEVSPSTLPPDRLQTGLDAPQNLLMLSQVEDDGWAGKVVLPNPTGFSPPDWLDTLLAGAKECA